MMRDDDPFDAGESEKGHSMAPANLDFNFLDFLNISFLSSALYFFCDITLSAVIVLLLRLCIAKLH